MFLFNKTKKKCTWLDCNWPWIEVFHGVLLKRAVFLKMIYSAFQYVKCVNGLEFRISYQLLWFLEDCCHPFMLKSLLLKYRTVNDLASTLKTVLVGKKMEGGITALDSVIVQVRKWFTSATNLFQTIDKWY